MNSEKFFTRKVIFAFVYLFIIIFLFVGMHYFSGRLSDDLLTSSYASIEEHTAQQKKIILTELDADSDNIELFAAILEHSDNLTESIHSVEKEYEISSAQDDFYHLDASGIGHNPAGILVDISAEDYFPLLKAGRTILSKVKFNASGNSFLILTPIMKEENLQGILVNEISTLYLENLLTPGFDDMLYTYIVDSLGNVIALNKNNYVILPSEPLRTLLQRAEYDQAAATVNSFEALLGDFAEGKSGYLNISYYDNVRLGYYTPLGINSWYLVSFLPEEFISDTIFTIETSMFIINIALLIIFMIIAIYITSILKDNRKLKRNLILELTSRIEVDPLTKLYTRVETESRITTYLQYTHDVQTSALLIIDLDDFKNVNTMFGEEYGDVILKESAQKVKKAFRESDIVGRIDRNLFIVLLRNVSDEKIIRWKAETILTSLASVELGSTGSYITASIGIAMCPTDGKNFKEIYEKADAAMYHVKVMGKAGYALYDKSLKHQIKKFTPSKEMKADKVITSDVDNIQSNIVNLIYGGQDTANTVTEMLNKIGSHYQLDRCGIFELDPNTKTLGNVFEFYTEKNGPINDTVQGIAGKDVEDFVDGVAELGIKEFIFFNELPTEVKKFFALQKISSAICGAFEYNGVKGFILLAFCGQGRKAWGSSYYDIITTASKLYAMRRKMN